MLPRFNHFSQIANGQKFGTYVLCTGTHLQGLAHAAGSEPKTCYHPQTNYPESVPDGDFAIWLYRGLHHH